MAVEGFCVHVIECLRLLIILVINSYEKKHKMHLIYKMHICMFFHTPSQEHLYGICIAKN